MDDPEFRAIVVDFVNRLDGRLDQIEAAVRAAKLDEVRSEAHWLKGVGGTVGFNQFTDPAAALERAAKQDDAGLAAKLLGDIRDIQARIVLPDESESAGDSSGVIDSGCESNSSNNAADIGPPIECALPLDDPAFAEIVTDFLQRLDDRLTGMKQLCEDQDFAALADEAHWLKGSGGTVGFMEFHEPAKALESAAKSGQIDEVTTALNDVLSVRRRIQAVC